MVLYNHEENNTLYYKEEILCADTKSDAWTTDGQQQSRLTRNT